MKITKVHPLKNHSFQFLFLSLFIFLISCINEEESKAESEREIPLTKAVMDSLIHSNKDNKLFLDYWYGMTENQFHFLKSSEEKMIKGADGSDLFPFNLPDGGTLWMELSPRYNDDRTIAALKLRSRSDVFIDERDLIYGKELESKYDREQRLDPRRIGGWNPKTQSLSTETANSILNLYTTKFGSALASEKDYYIEYNWQNGNSVIILRKYQSNIYLLNGKEVTDRLELLAARMGQKNGERKEIPIVGKYVWGVEIEYTTPEHLEYLRNQQEEEERRKRLEENEAIQKTLEAI